MHIVTSSSILLTIYSGAQEKNNLQNTWILQGTLF